MINNKKHQQEAAVKTKNINNLETLNEIFLDTTQEKLNAPKIFSKQDSTKIPLIEIKNLVKTFGRGKGKVLAVNDITININRNENMALLGANGAGKTTLVEIIVGINKPTSGGIKYDYEYDVGFQEQLGIQFQDSTYPFGLKVKDVVNFMVDVYDVKITKDELHKMIKMFGLEQYWKKFARSLSGGQQQRLNILLALLHKPKLIFLDELSTGLDISVKEQIINFVGQYCRINNINIVLVSHDVAEIELLCDRVVIMQKGIIKVDMYMKDVKEKFGSITNLLRQYI